RPWARPWAGLSTPGWPSTLAWRELCSPTRLRKSGWGCPGGCGEGRTRRFVLAVCAGDPGCRIFAELRPARNRGHERELEAGNDDALHRSRVRVARLPPPRADASPSSFGRCRPAILACIGLARELRQCRRHTPDVRDGLSE